MTVHRRPDEVESTRMAPLARLPVFFSLVGKRAVVSGGTPAAVWKAELLSAAGAQVDVFAPSPSEEMLALTANAPAGAVALHRRPCGADDLPGAAIAVADCADDGEAAAFAAAARATGVPVNIVDRPAFSDFALGAIVNRSPLVIGISTDGASPVFGQAIRAKIEALIPRGFARWAATAARWRPRVQALGLPFRNRRDFWERFTARALAAPDHVPDDSEFDSLPAAGDGAGSVAVVDTSAGDPELLTLRAVRALQSADAILFDAGVTADMLDFARREAKKMLIDATGETPARALMISLAQARRRVVRLRSGGPPRAGDADLEIEACRAAGIAVEVVPGVAPAHDRAETADPAPKARNIASNKP